MASSLASRLLDVIQTRRLVLADKVFDDVFTEPGHEFGEFLAESSDGLCVHISLSD